jgi:hypothetical protein
LLRAAGLFIGSQRRIGDGAFLDLSMVEARRSFRRASRLRWSWAVAATSAVAETQRIDLYFSIFYDFRCKAFRIIILFQFVF